MAGTYTKSEVPQAYAALPKKVKEPGQYPRYEAKLQAKDVPAVAGLRLSGCGIDSDGLLLANAKAKTDNDLITVMHTAFCDEVPVELRPDDIWMAIMQALAVHVTQNPEQLRCTLGIEHEGKKDLHVHDDGLVLDSAKNDWTGAFDALAGLIRVNVRDEVAELLATEFSTSTVVSKMASQCVMFECFSKYFSYHTHTMCGIPEIYLRGMPSDWGLVRDSARALLVAIGDLEWWSVHLLPVLDEFVKLSEHSNHGVELSEASCNFWTHMYHYASGSGGPKTNGWFNVFFPYTTTSGGGFAMNRCLDWEKCWCGNEPGSFPAGYTSTPFTWHYFGKDIAAQYIGGFFGTQQDKRTGALRPAIGWAVATEDCKQCVSCDCSIL